MLLVDVRVGLGVTVVQLVTVEEVIEEGKELKLEDAAW